MMLEFSLFVADHPPRFNDPRLGRPALLSTEYYVRHINGLNRKENDAPIGELHAHLRRPENIYTHEWRLHALLIWDNLALQHARTKRADPDESPRALQRVAVNEVGCEELTARARRRECETVA